MIISHILSESEFELGKEKSPRTFSFSFWEVMEKERSLGGLFLRPLLGVKGSRLLLSGGGFKDPPGRRLNHTSRTGECEPAV